MPNVTLQSAGRNVLAGLVLLALFTLLDWFAVSVRFVEAELLLITPLSLVAHLLVPTVFWGANRSSFSGTQRPRVYRVLLALALTGVWWAMALPVLLLVHTAMGGKL